MRIVKNTELLKIRFHVNAVYEADVWLKFKDNLI